VTFCSMTHCSRPTQARGLCMTHYQQERRAELGPEWTVWLNLIQRCTDPNHPRYHRYGGRGITVDDRYLGEKGFDHFIEDVGQRPPSPEGWTSRKAYWSIDRIDNDRGYEPGNLRWATASQQAYNRKASA
jgi:hypothetical protein